MSNLTHSTGFGQGTGNQTLLENPDLCTLKTCDLSLASFLYIPNFLANAIFAGIFGVCLIGQLGLGIKYKTWGFMIAMIMGLLLEAAGYGARIWLHYDPFYSDAFLMSLVTLTIAPAFITASIYLCLGRIVMVYGEHLSRFKSRTYTIVFCSFDFICLLLQAAGGALAASADTREDSDLGKNIMLAGLIFQVVALIVFLLASGEFAIRVFRSKGFWNQKYNHVVNSVLFKCFLVGLFTATITVLIRSAYRIVELWGGFESELFVSHEEVFMILEGGMLSVACCCLTFLHPAVCFQGVWHDANFTFRAKKANHVKLDSVSFDEESNMINGVELNTMRH